MSKRITEQGGMDVDRAAALSGLLEDELEDEGD